MTTRDSDPPSAPSEAPPATSPDEPEVSDEPTRSEEHPASGQPSASADTPDDLEQQPETVEASAPKKSKGRGGSLRGTVGAWVMVLLGLGVSFLVMANDLQWRFSPIVVFVACSVAVIGLLKLLGALTLVSSAKLSSAVGTADESDPSTAVEEQRPLASVEAALPLAPARLLASLAVFMAAGWFAVRGVYPAHQITAAVLITSSFLWLTAEVFWCARRVGMFGIDETGRDRPLSQRHGFWLIALGAILYLPGLGNFSLIDPWETHYGEVAREMIARDDWISLWWAHDGWFWSKPILNFWLQGLSFKLFGIDALPDQMMAGVAQGYTPQPEWACRLPIFFLTIVGFWIFYRSMVRPLGRRAALLGGIVLMTCPYWYILARQTMADMPYVAPLCAAMGLLLMGFNTEPEARCREYRVKLWRWQFSFTGMHVLLGMVLLLVLPQVLYLFSRNLTFHTSDLAGFRPHLDEFAQGSGGENCGLPGNKRCRGTDPKYEWGQPALWGLVWLVGALVLVFVKRNEWRRQRVLFLAAWLCVTLAVMAKGAPGLVLPIGAALTFVAVSGRWRDLARLELPWLLVLVLVVALPWYVQMYMRHGQPFFERLIMHDMVKRAFVHVHDTNKGDDVSFRYYVWQLGYGLFPWTGLCAGGLIWWISQRTRRAIEEHQAILFLMTWWLLAFGMFSITLTKFHHYIFPLVPPTAMLTGLMLERYAPTRLQGGPRQWFSQVALILGGLSLVLVGIVVFLPGGLTSQVPESGELPDGQRALGVGLGALGVAMLAASHWLYGRQPEESGGAEGSSLGERVSLGVIAVASAVGVGLAGRDMFVTREGDIEGHARIIHLFTYNYSRNFPESLDFRPSLLAFTLVATVVALLLAWPRVRRQAVVAVCCLGGLYSVWLMGVYLMRISPHWGQRETMVAYYQHREDPKEMLVAYQMNWKGENFYTGNRMATFVSSGTKFKQWIKKQRRKGVDTMYFTTEHSRMGSLKRELDNPSDFEVLTDETLNNKFFLARVRFDELSAKERGAKTKKKSAKSKSKASKARANKPTGNSDKLEVHDEQGGEEGDRDLTRAERLAQARSARARGTDSGR